MMDYAPSHSAARLDSTRGGSGERRSSRMAAFALSSAPTVHNVFPGFPLDPVWMIDLETGAVDTAPLNDFHQALESIDSTSFMLSATSLSPDGTKTVRVELDDPPITTGRLSGIRIIVEQRR